MQTTLSSSLGVFPAVLPSTTTSYALEYAAYLSKAVPSTEWGVAVARDEGRLIDELTSSLAPDQKAMAFDLLSRMPAWNGANTRAQVEQLGIYIRQSHAVLPETARVIMHSYVATVSRLESDFKAPRARSHSASSRRYSWK